jgi:hypothetical protein
VGNWAKWTDSGWTGLDRGKILEDRMTNLLENLKPDVLRPVRSDRGQHESLQLNVAQDGVLVHSHASGVGSFTVAVTGAGEVVQAGLQGKLEVGTK